MSAIENREQWLAGRRQGIGGSDIAAILGLSPYRTAVDVWLDKRGLAEELEENEAMYWGITLEEVVSKEFQIRNNTKVQRVNRILQHEANPWMQANIDRIVWEGNAMPVNSFTGELRSKHLLECKTAGAFVAHRWGNDEDTLPLEYTCQAMWYLAVTGADICDVACLIGGQKYIQRRIVRDDAVIASMIESARVFWFDHVQTGIAPEPVNGDDVAKLFKQDNGTSIQANEEMLMCIDRLTALKAELKTLENEEEELQDALKIKLGEASNIEYNGSTLVTWRKSSDSNKTNWKEAAASIKKWVLELGITEGDNSVSEIINTYTKTQSGSRRFLIK